MVREGVRTVPEEEAGRRAHREAGHSTSRGAGVAGSNQAEEVELHRVHMVDSLHK